MTEHSGLPVAGYRPQSDDRVLLVNHNKFIEERVLRMLDELAAMPAPNDAPTSDSITVDKRWLAIGRTHVEQAFMAINRAVFQPARVATLPEDMPAA